MAINLQLVTPNFAHPNLFHHTEQMIEDIHAKCNVFYILGYKTLTAYVQIFLSVLGPFSNSQFDTFHLHLSYFRAIFLSNSSVHYYKHLSTCHRQTNVFSKVWINSFFCKADKCITVTHSEGQTNKKLLNLLQLFSQFLVCTNTNIYIP